MSGYKYSTKMEENSAKAVSQSLHISTKISGQVCRFVRGMPLTKAKIALNEVIAKKRAVPMMRHYKETAHRKGMAVGRYPVKAATNILQVIESAEANAQYKGLSSANLVIHHAVAQKGPTMRGQGRVGGKAKRTHIEIVLQEKKIVKKEPKTKVPAKEAQKAAPKTEVKKEEPKIAEKKEETPKVEEKKTETVTAEKPKVEQKKETEVKAVEEKPAPVEKTEAPKTEEKKEEKTEQPTQATKETIGEKKE